MLDRNCSKRRSFFDWLRAPLVIAAIMASAIFRCISSTVARAFSLPASPPAQCRRYASCRNLNLSVCSCRHCCNMSCTFELVRKLFVMLFRYCSLNNAELSGTGGQGSSPHIFSTNSCCGGGRVSPGIRDGRRLANVAPVSLLRYSRRAASGPKIFDIFTRSWARVSSSKGRWWTWFSYLRRETSVTKDAQSLTGHR